MKNTYNKILPIIVFLSLVLSFNNSKAATGTPATYFNTIYVWRRYCESSIKFNK